ncbi:MAG: hypothetical protein KAI83_18095, partial [Thiomargarita sp.]|nr:hypothetical protein [Thiomargarita sp.]
MTKFIYPTLDLFLYDLREGLGQTEENVEENRRLFKQKLVKINDEDFDRRDKQYLEPEYVELLGERYSKFDSEIHEGYDYPVRLGDTYGLLLDCSCKEEQEAVDLQWLRDLKVQINERLKGKSGTIGQTWIFSAQLPSVPTQEYEKLAKQCYEALIPGANSVDKMGKSDFLGGCLFEFWQYTSPELSSAENPHLIMIFYPNEKAAKEASLLYHDWMFLLMYRHKMMWAYNQSRLLKKDLKREAVKIQACNKEVSENSNIPLNFKVLQETLRKAWDVLPRYTTELSYLDDQSRTLEINQDNYQKRLESLEEKIGEKGLPLAKFGETMRDKYLRQVKRDHALRARESR